MWVSLLLKLFRGLHLSCIKVTVVPEALVSKYTKGKAVLVLHLTETGREGLGWIDLAQDRDKWRAVVNTAMNLRVP